MADVTMSAGQEVDLPVRAVGVDDSDQTAQLSSATWSVDSDLLTLATQDAAGLVQLASSSGATGTTTVTVVATAADGSQYTATCAVTIVPAPVPAIARVEIVPGTPRDPF